MARVRPPVVWSLPLAAVFVAACGSSSAPPEDGGHGADEMATQTARRATAYASQEFLEAQQSHQRCVAEAGYPGNPYTDGVVLRDGSLFRPAPGAGYSASGATLEYLLVRQTCAQSTGFAAISARYLPQEGSMTPAQAKAFNDGQILHSRCMEAKGWDVPEPATLNGMLIFDYRFEDAEERAAHLVDAVACTQEVAGE